MMEIQLQELIEQIKRDGVEAAEIQAAEILKAAQAQADQMISEAQAQADAILRNARKETDQMTAAGEEAIRQAGRNLLISFRESVVRELQTITKDNVSEVYSSEDFAKLIVRGVEGWVSQPDAGDISVILNSKDLKRLEETLLAEFRNRMLTGVTLSASDHFDGGFRISIQNGSAYYDYTTEAVVDMLSNYLSPRITKLLKEA